MFLDEAHGAKEKMTKYQHHPDEVGQESGPEAGVNIGENGDDNKSQRQQEPVSDDKIVKLHNGKMDRKDREGAGLTIRLKVVVQFDPVAVGVLAPELADAVGPAGDGAAGAGPVFEGDAGAVQGGHHVFQAGGAEAEMGLFIGDGFSGFAVFDQVQVGLFTDGKPGMPAVLKGVGDGWEADDIAVKSHAGGQVGYRQGDVVDAVHAFSYKRFRGRKLAIFREGWGERANPVFLRPGFLRSAGPVVQWIE